MKWIQKSDKNDWTWKANIIKMSDSFTTDKIKISSIINKMFSLTIKFKNLISQDISYNFQGPHFEYVRVLVKNDMKTMV